MRSTQPEQCRVLVVEDEPALARALEVSLRARGYAVATARAGRHALAQAASLLPHVVLLDLGLPDIEGTEVIRELRSWSDVPVVVLSGRTSPADKVGALDAGADDFVTKPFSMDELLARLRAALRRPGAQARAPGPAAGVSFSIGSCVVDLEARTAVRQAAGGEPGQVHLTRTEWQMLEILFRSAGRPVPAARLSAELGGTAEPARTVSGTLRVHMARLRRKLEDDPPRPRHLLTEPGMGYRYQP